MRQFRALIPHGDLGRMLKAAGLSSEWWRGAENGVKSPRLASLHSLAKVLNQEISVQISSAGQSGSGNVTNVTTEATDRMHNDDELGELTDEERGILKGYRLANANPAEPEPAPHRSRNRVRRKAK